MELSIKDLVEKRRLRWEETKSIELDELLKNAICDKILDSETLRNEIIKAPYLLIECCFSIVDKKKRNIPFFFNDVQHDFINQLERLGTKKPFFILKGRQQGFTTLITAIQLSYAIVRKNFSGFTIADRDDNTKAIFIDKAKQMYNCLPQRLKPTEKFNSVNELFFDKLNSSWRVCSASSNVGRSRTLSFVHYSEVAFYSCPLSDLQKSIGEATIDGAFCVYETTANGFNESKKLWDSGACNNLFYQWWKTKEYTSNEYEYLKNQDTWLQNRLLSLEKLGLSLEQRTWYAKKYSSYIDKSSIKQEYPCFPEEAFISSGNCIFNKDAISEYLSTFDIKARKGVFKYDKVAHPIYSPDKRLIGCTYTLENIEFIDTPLGYISIVESPHNSCSQGKEYRKPYVIGADTAGTGEDYFTAKVIDNITSRSVATLRIQHIDEDLFAEQLYCLGKYYNNALIAVETNYSRHPIRHLRSLGYENLYLSKSLSTFKEEGEKHYGFLTTSVSRPIIISNLVSVMRENLFLETDRETLKEMTTFIKRSDGKCSASNGAHDDLVMATAIARFVALDYEHNMEIIDTSLSFLSSNFSQASQKETYLEW